VNFSCPVFIGLVVPLALCACATSTPESEAKRVGAPARESSFICDAFVTKSNIPPYPGSAFRQGVEGWVLLEFALDGTGAAKNIVVVDANPRGVFERSATEGLKATQFNLNAVQSKCQALVTYTLH